jgi:hypothetical protein
MIDCLPSSSEQHAEAAISKPWSLVRQLRQLLT